MGFRVHKDKSSTLAAVQKTVKKTGREGVWVPRSVDGNLTCVARG
jgi:hypothetical protein